MTGTGERILEWSKSNPGAMGALMGLFRPENVAKSVPIMAVLESCPSIRGTNLYVLFNDLCNRDYNLMLKLCVNCPGHILEDACNRQDYSGQELVAKYLK